MIRALVFVIHFGAPDFSEAPIPLAPMWAEARSAVLGSTPSRWARTSWPGCLHNLWFPKASIAVHTLDRGIMDIGIDIEIDTDIDMDMDINT